MTPSTEPTLRKVVREIQLSPVDRDIDPYVERLISLIESEKKAFAVEQLKKVIKTSELLNPSHAHPHIKSWTIAVDNLNDAIASLEEK